MTVEQKAEEYANNEMENWNYKFSDEIEYKVKQIWLDGFHECQKEYEWHKDGVPEITHKTCVALIDRLPNVILVFWNGEVWIDTRTLEKYKKVNAWKYVDFPQEVE